MKQGWEIKKLGEVCKISPPKSEIKAMNLKDETLVSFLPMEDLGINQMYICPHNSRSLSEVSGGYTYFAENDILLAKVTPCFENGKLGIVKDLCSNIGFGSSEYIVIRADESNVKSEYIYYGLMTDAFKKNGARLMLGASGLKRLPKGYVANYELGIPSELSEQERIVGVLDSAFAKIEALRANAQQNLQNTKDLFQASLKQELTPKEGWKEVTIEDVCTLKSGNSNANNSGTGELPYVKVSDMNIEGNELYITHSSLYVDRIKNKKGIFPIGTTIFPKRGGAIATNKKRITGIEVCCDLNIMGVIPSSKIVPMYLFFFFQGVDLGQLFDGASIPQINNKDIAPLVIGLPTIKEQQAIVKKLDALSERCRAMEENYRQIITHCNALKQALLTKAFNGEL